MKANIGLILKEQLCAGCGFCSVVCPEKAITMSWKPALMWEPSLDLSRCKGCGQCLRVCPNSPESICEYAIDAAKKGERFGLPKSARYFISYDLDKKARIRSASGGTITAILKYLLESGEIQGVITSVPLSAPIGNPHYGICIINSPEDLDGARSSHYHPLCYAESLEKIEGNRDSYALVGIPCVIRGVKRLPQHIQNKIHYTISPVCSHNVTAAFLDCLALQEGISKREIFFANLRDKCGDISDANNFNNYFRLPDREIRQNRFQTMFTDMWRGYYFAQGCCLYCPDFYGSEADLSVKDGWGRLSKDPLGVSLLMVRNPGLAPLLRDLNKAERIYLEPCSQDEIFMSQAATPVFKHIQVRDRLVWKKSIRQQLIRQEYPIGATRRLLSGDSWRFLRFKIIVHLSGFLYLNFGHRSINCMIYLTRTLHKIKSLLFKVCKIIRKYIIDIPFSLIKYIFGTGAYFIGFKSRKHPVDIQNLRVLISGGYGYGNIGDEAQLAANLAHWRNASPSCQLTVLTPSPHYTRKTHPNVQTELASRLSLFGLKGRTYFGSDRVFKMLYFILAPLYLLNACLARASLPVWGLTTRQARLLDEINNTDVLFLSGGGYLTGMTWTRLWDNMLLIRLAHVFGVPVLLSGQTIGVFKDPISRFLARWGLGKAELIYLRDSLDSPKDLAALGIPEEKIKSTFDDALFFQAAPKERAFALLKRNNIDPDNPYLVVNVHYWGQKPTDSRVIMKQIASALDRIRVDLGLQIVFVPMHRCDEKAMGEVISLMQKSGVIPPHDYDPELAAGLIRNATLCLTMKHHPIVFAMRGGVPTVSMTFDDYYYHKNRGALKIFGLEDFVISGNIDELGKDIQKKVKEIYRQRESLSRQIRACIEEVKPAAGEVINRWVSKFGIEHFT